MKKRWKQVCFKKREREADRSKRMRNERGTEKKRDGTVYGRRKFKRKADGPIDGL